MKAVRTVIALVFTGLISVAAHAGPGWTVLTFSVAPLDAPKMVAAIDKWYAAGGKDYPGQVTLLFNEADGTDPATYTILQTYPSVAAQETFGAAVQSDEKLSAAWAELLGAMATIATPVQRARGTFLGNRCARRVRRDRALDELPHGPEGARSAASVCRSGRRHRLGVAHSVDRQCQSGGR